MTKVMPPSGDFTDIKLLQLESDPMMLYGDGITTMQFYKGDGLKAADFLKKLGK